MNSLAVTEPEVVKLPLPSSRVLCKVLTAAVFVLTLKLVTEDALLTDRAVLLRPEMIRGGGIVVALETRPEELTSRRPVDREGR
jgi:hypothetical protein